MFDLNNLFESMVAKLNSISALSTIANKVYENTVEEGVARPYVVFTLTNDNIQGIYGRKSLYSLTIKFMVYTENDVDGTGNLLADTIVNSLIDQRLSLTGQQWVSCRPVSGIRSKFASHNERATVWQADRQVEFRILADSTVSSSQIIS